MVVELRTKSQVTIPKAIVNDLGLAEGDKFDIMVKDGEIHLIPVAVYPKKYVETLQKEFAAVEAKLKSGEQPVFNSASEMLNNTN